MLITGLTRKFNTARKFSLSDWAIFIYAWIWLAGYRILCEVIPYPLWRHRLLKYCNPPIKNTTNLVEESRENNLKFCANISQIVNIASRYQPISTRCLHQSWTLVKILKNQNIAAQMHLGVSLSHLQPPANQQIDFLHSPSSFAAHAWVEYDGHVLNDAQNVAQRYSRLNPLTDVCNI